MDKKNPQESLVAEKHVKGAVELVNRGETQAVESAGPLHEMIMREAGSFAFQLILSGMLDARAFDALVRHTVAVSQASALTMRAAVWEAVESHS